MGDRAAQEGAGVINLLLALVVLIFVGLALTQFLPAQTRRSQLADFMVDQSQTAARVPPKTINQRIFKKAKDLGIPVEKENCSVVKTAGNVRMKCSWVEPFNFVIYQYDWDIEVEVDRPIFQF